jgi:hypothetical protein
MGLAYPARKNDSSDQGKWPRPSSESSLLTDDRKEAMEGFLGWIRRNGGIEKYLTESGIMSPDQIQRLRENLIVALPTATDQDPRDAAPGTKQAGA